MSAGRPSARPGLHRFAVVLTCLVVGLIAAGALVKSKDAGLSVPDWPTSYGSFNPPRWWQIENVRAEHGHRLYAGTVALLTIGLAVWAARREPRPWVRRVAYAAVGAVLVQAVLGGLTVLYFLPPSISIAHAAVAELFLCLVATVALATSSTWRLPALPSVQRDKARRLAPWATALTVTVYAQILLGALVRHNDAGMAIPDFPLAFGRLVPAHFDFKIAIHYAHRVGALVVTALLLVVATRVLRAHRGERLLTVPAVALLALVAIQIGLGGAIVLTGRAVAVNTLHVATGATVLLTSLLLTLNAWRLRGLRAAQAVAGSEPGRREVAA